MERIASSSRQNDRSEREELESAQMALRDARQRLVTAGQDGLRELEAMQVAIAEAEQRGEAARVRLQNLEEEQASLKERQATLERMLEAQKKEQQVLLLGEALRDEHVEWEANPLGYNEPGRRVPAALGPALLAVALMAAMIVGILLLFGARR
jgi:hypothetical protein